MTKPGPAVDRNLMREMNKRTIFNLIRVHAPVSRTVLAELSGLSLGTVINLTNILIDERLILETGEAESTGGRKAGLLEIQPGGAFAIGLYPGDNFLEGVILDLNGDVVFSASWEFSLFGPSEVGLNSLAQKTNELIAQGRVDRSRIIGVGLGLAGTINPDTGYCVDSWHFGWHNVPVRDQLSTRLSLPVYVENVLNCLTSYELVFNRGRSYQNLLVVAVGGRGLGLGIVINGNLYRGAWGGGAELGHTIYQAGGRQCECGNNGCLEEYVTDRGILSNYLELLPPKTESKLDRTLPDREQIELLLQLARKGDKVAQVAFEQAGSCLGIGLANLVNLFSPECIVINTEHSEAREFLIEPARDALQMNTFSQLGKQLKLVVEPLKKSDWARGAGSIVLRNFYSSPSSGKSIWGSNLVRLREQREHSFSEARTFV